ncbi:Jlp1p [Sugiyamaella lignohabitans]|uniref:Jlp1p n=1 Tax=Sugiyamaella lignohabitans TaxID=796027 RepID=A0A161HGJ2_9ASCO|nr:Jlp1p [Sugiyamaella lignohabitans]ANB11931.1 Jlp1p [Sugiyamaella lignohabitans]
MSPPTAVEIIEEGIRNQSIKTNNAVLKEGFAANYIDKLPEHSRKRFERHGVDLSRGYPERPSHIPIWLDEAAKIHSSRSEYVEKGAKADPEKKALFGAAKEVINLTKHIGTEIVGLQLADLNQTQLDELALLIAERSVVFFRDQDLAPQKQLEIGKYFGDVEIHPQVPHVPGLPGVSVIWPDFQVFEGRVVNFRKPGGASGWHTDLDHLIQSAAITHLHNDEIPAVGGDTSWSSGYGLYDKLSPALQKFLEGKTAIHRSAHAYLDKNDQFGGPKYIETEHPIVRTHPATGWKAVWVNRAHTVRIVGLEPAESAAILNLLYDIIEKNLDIQVRFRWQPTKEGLGTSALWDNRITIHNAVGDYSEPRHGTRVSGLGEKPYYDPNSKSRHEALGLSV